MARKNFTRSRRPVLVFAAKSQSVSPVKDIVSGQQADAVICTDLVKFCGKISDQVEAILIVGDLFLEKAIPKIAEKLHAQSGPLDLPIVAAVTNGADSPVAADALHKLGNVLVLGYPFTQASLKHALQIAFRNRENQRRFRGLAKEYEQAMNALQESHHQLEQKVQDRTQELTDSVARLRRLTGRMILSEQRDRARLAGILHDHLQQLLVSAKYRVAALRSIEDPTVTVAVQEIEELFDEVIEASRSLTSELYPPIVHESSLRTIMEWLVSFMAAQRGFDVQLKMEDGMPSMDESTKVLLFESIRELLLNALKHAHVRSAEISIRRVEGDVLEIVVADEGSGFNPDLEDQKGFGLFRIRERLKLIGGRLEIRSSPDKGSRITIIAPLSETRTQVRPAPVESRAHLQTEATIPRPEQPVSGMIRILIADDHAVMRQGLSVSLSLEPDIVIVGEAIDGKMALEKTRNLRPDVVLMDLGMPQMNGIEATQRIHSEMPKVRVIGLSMFDEKERASAMFRAGAVAYLSKSCSVHALTAAIRKCVGKSELRSR
jgi:signal transduction histidine kinase/CheY-like chemotaxis protein